MGYNGKPEYGAAMRRKGGGGWAFADLVHRQVNYGALLSTRRANNHRYRKP